jgi:hypothetical protein
VTAIEKETGKSKHITIRNAFAAKSAEEIAAARRRLEALWAAREMDFAAEDELEEGDVLDEVGEEAATAIPAPLELPGRDEAERLLERSRRLLGRIHADDVEEAVALNERIETAIAEDNAGELAEAVTALRELLFFLEAQ